MCGIVGKVSSVDAVDEALLARMCSTVEHRGPDSRGTFFDDGVGLGVQRLRVIDLATGDQPISNEDGSVVIVLNGEIYNYRELRDRLEARGHRFSTRSDTEVIVHLYEEHGADCVRQLRGMFAFALWDRRRRRLLLARDRVGKKPLFYRVDGDTLWFASEVRAILEDPDVDRAVDAQAIDSFLQYQYVPHPLSAFAGIRKLPGAHTLLWEEGGVALARYWRLSYRPAQPLPARAEALERIRELVLEATRLRLRSDVPLGAFLSGGVDSSAVVAAMAMEMPGKVKTFSIGFDIAAYDETPYAREVAQLYDTDHHELHVEPHAVEILPKLVWHYGEPFADHSAIPSFYLAELARAEVTVALNGDGGDESFAGYPRYLGFGMSARLGRLPLPARHVLAGVARSLGGSRSEEGFRARLRRVTSRALLEPNDRYALWMAYFNESERDELYTADFEEVVDAAKTADVIGAPFRASDAEDPVNRLLDVDVQTYLQDDLLTKMDIATMAHSLEVRSPLLDHELMEYAATLPGAWKATGTSTKKLFKEALAPWLPQHILHRDKKGFSVPLADWLAGDLRELPRDVLLDRASLERGYFREAAVRRLIDDHVSRRRDNANKLWALIQLELWLRTFIDAKPRRPLALST